MYHSKDRRWSLYLWVVSLKMQDSFGMYMYSFKEAVPPSSVGGKGGRKETI